jgi:hypothetical protein
MENMHRKIPTANKTFSEMTSSSTKIRIISRMRVNNVNTKRDKSSPL